MGAGGEAGARNEESRVPASRLLCAVGKGFVSCLLSKQSNCGCFMMRSRRARIALLGACSRDGASPALLALALALVFDRPSTATSACHAPYIFLFFHAHALQHAL